MKTSSFLFPVFFVSFAIFYLFFSSLTTKIVACQTFWRMWTEDDWKSITFDRWTFISPYYCSSRMRIKHWVDSIKVFRCSFLSLSFTWSHRCLRRHWIKNSIDHHRLDEFYLNDLIEFSIFTLHKSFFSSIIWKQCIFRWRLKLRDRKMHVMFDLDRTS